MNGSKRCDDWSSGAPHVRCELEKNHVGVHEASRFGLSTWGLFLEGASEPLCGRVLDVDGRARGCVLPAGHQGPCEHASIALRAGGPAPESTEALIARLTAERDATRRQVTELQEAATKHVLERRTSLRAQAREFHAVFGQPTPERPAVPSAERVRLRLRLIAEEFVETMRACGDPSNGLDAAKLSEVEDLMSRWIDGAAIRVDLVATIDGLADVLYVVMGSFLELGVDPDPVLAEVHRSNLSKWPSAVRSDGKIQKSAHYSPPDLASVLRAQGWESA